MKKGMCITYEVDSGLYINLTNRCTNRCSFCIRNNGDGAYGSDSLWLEREPTGEEILADILKRDLTKYTELVFCGYGEPTLRLDEMLWVAREVKRCCNIPTRVNTNGHGSLICGRDITPMLADCIDTVSVSLNSPTPDGYLEMCHPVYGKTAHDALIEFTKNVKNYVQNVMLSVVVDTLSAEEVLACEKIASDIGVELKKRSYIGP